MMISLVSLLVCMLTPNIVTGHGFIVDPELTWVVNPFYDKNAPASFYQSTEAERLQNPLDVYPNLRFIVDRDTPNTNIPVIAANANKKCGMTSPTGTARSISGSFQFGNYPGTGVVPHVGPCEVWVDDVRTMVSRYCLNDYPSWRIPVDMSKCTRSTCVVQFIWVATHNPGYEVFKNCFLANGGSSGGTPTTSPTSSPTTSPTTCKIAANGGSCGASNGVNQTMKYHVIALLAGMLMPNVVTGHGFIVTPELTWVVNPFYDKNAPASFYQSTDAERLQNPLDVYPNLRFIVDRDVPNTNIAVIAANANKKCGMTSPTGSARSISTGYFQFGNYPGTGVIPHKGPCEVWVDDVRTLVSRDCLTEFPSWKIPVDMTKCTRATCVVQFIWVATHNPGYEVFKNCFPAIGGGTPPQSTTVPPTSLQPTTQPPVCTTAPSGGSCGSANGGVYCPGTQCCSQYGYCGVGSPWCNANPNSGYNGGKCSTTTTPKCTIVAAAGGGCGASNGGAYCPGTQCCSQYGYCGVGSPWCDSNPNSAYNGGKCTALLLAQDAEEGQIVQNPEAKQAEQAQQAAQATDVSTVTLSNGAASLDTILTRRVFDRVFPDTEGSVLTYDGLLEAAQSYTEFGQSPNAAINVLEVAYFLAHVAYTTGDLTYPAERDGSQYSPEKYCQRSSEVGCAPGGNYYGRGPLYLRWNFNYYECAKAIGMDIYTNPDGVLQSPVTAWKTALWTWFDLGIHEMSTLPNAFALSTNKLVGEVECGNSPSATTANAARVAKFKSIAKVLNAKGVSKLQLSCVEESEELLAAEVNANGIVAKARFMGAETKATANTADWTSVAVVGVAMTAFVVVAVIKRTAGHATPNVENGDYALLATYE
ncbi:hypothetical protein PHYBOEH_007029 [Phytophthora boehmeriae]|uniref:Chitin-binding type-1 domain-containing protein n=1 Tax=Phytophthora boehmeriae TaxID=109152 RepID=A0A8T1WFQ6_9STRA|nr:hypothetical protein PHYBOEH_007029 [Phytophthora boehmeriae]